MVGVVKGINCSMCFLFCFVFSLQKVMYWVASPSLPLRLYGNTGKVRGDSVCVCVVVVSWAQGLRSRVQAPLWQTFLPSGFSSSASHQPHQSTQLL